MAILLESTIDTLTAGRGNSQVVTNTAFGLNALKLNTSGGNNTAIGINALTANTTGQENTAIGAYAGDAIAGGNNNIAIGFNALTAVNSGYKNIAIGQAALGAQTTSNQLVAIGAQAGRCVTTGAGSSIFLGWRAGFSNTGGGQAVGVKAGYSITTNGTIAAVGYCAISVSNPTQNWPVAVGTCALRQLTGGYIAAVGFCAGATNTSGTSNVFIGTLAGKSVVTNQDQMHVGDSAGCSSATNRSNFLGASAGVSSTGYAANVLGYCAAGADTNNCQSVNIGYRAGLGPTSSCRTLFLGACSQPSTGKSVSIGFKARGGQCNETTSVGLCTGNALTTGNCNVLIGHYAGCAITTGYGINIIGYKAGLAMTTQKDTIIIGAQAQQSYNQRNIIAVGAGAQTSGNDNHTVWGNAYNNVCNCIQLQWATPSDCRDKINIEPLDPKLGLQFLNKIRPVSFNWDNRDLYVKKCGFEYGKKDGTLAGDKERYGIIAQEVLQILDNLDVNWDGVKGTEKSYRVKHDHFFASLVAALQELSQEVDTIEQQILQLEK